MTTWPIESKKERSSKLILFLISPFVAFLYSLKSMNTKSTFAVFFGFAVCFGMAFSIESFESLSTTSSGVDAGRYRLEFERSANMSTAEFVRDMKAYFDFDEGDKDFYYIAMVYLVSRFTHNYHWLFMAFAFVFAFFQLKSLKILVDEEHWNNSLLCVLLAVFFTWNQIFNINAMRFYTAAWVAVYAMLQIFLNGRKRYFLLLFITPFFHSSFVLLAAIVVLAFLLKRFERVWMVLFVVSFFSSTVFANLLLRSVDYLPDFLANTVSNYADLDRLFEETTFSGSGFWWVPMLFDRAYKIYTNLLVVILIFNRKTIRETKCKNLYLLAIIFMTYINFAMPIPALGRRSIVMAYPIIAYLWLSCFELKRFNGLVYAFPFVWAWQIMTYFSFYKLVLDLSFFVTSPFYMIYKYLIVS